MSAEMSKQMMCDAQQRLNQSFLQANVSFIDRASLVCKQVPESYVLVMDSMAQDVKNNCVINHMMDCKNRRIPVPFQSEVHDPQQQMFQVWTKDNTSQILHLSSTCPALP